MTDQLDLFVASAESTEPKKEDLQSNFSNKLTPRQWALLNLIKNNSFIGKRKTSQREIYDALKGYGYEWNDDEKAHDHCSAIWNDIKDINLSYETDKLIISKNFEYWVGDEEQTQAFIDKLWSDLEPRLMRYWAYLKKVNRNGQGQLLSRKLQPIDDNSKARSFIESYGKERIGD